MNISNPPVHVKPMEITPEGQNLLQNLLELKVSVAGREFPAMGIEINPKSQEFLDEPGSCCMTVFFPAPAVSLSGNEPVVISYRQPLHESGGVRRLFYAPGFFGLPSKYWGSITNQGCTTLSLSRLRRSAR